MIDDPYTVAVGDSVTIHTGRRETHTGVVAKIGPKRVHVDEGGRLEQYRRDDQQRCDGAPGHFETMAQAEDRVVREATLDSLRADGVDMRTHRHSWTTAQLVALLEAAQTIRR